MCRFIFQCFFPYGSWNQIRRELASNKEHDSSCLLCFCFFFYLGPINAIAISPNGEIITGSNDSTLRVWSLSSGECQAVYDGHMSSVLCLVLTCDGESVISGSEDKTVKAWHLKTKSCVTFKGHSGKLEKNS